jgi:hypothetical protein
LERAKLLVDGFALFLPSAVVFMFFSPEVKCHDGQEREEEQEADYFHGVYGQV